MAIGCGAKCAKLILVIFNFFFWLSGAAILGVGIWLMIDTQIVRFIKVIQLSAEDPYISTAAYILIGVGAFIFVVGFFGCCGAIKESKCMLGLYLFFLIIVMAGELAAGILVAVFKGTIETKLKTGMQEQVKNTYGNGSDFDKVWDYVQYEKQQVSVPLSCCVMKKTANFDKMEAQNLAECRSQATDVMNGGSPPEQPMFHNKVCYKAITGWFNMYATILIGVACGIAALEIFGFVFAVCLCRNLGDVDD